MAVVRWNPWNDVFDLHAQMDHLFQPAAATTSRNGVEYTTLPVDIRQTDAAFAALQQAIDNREPRVVWIRTTPWCDALRRDARFSDALKQINLA